MICGSGPSCCKGCFSLWLQKLLNAPTASYRGWRWVVHDGCQLLQHTPFVCRLHTMCHISSLTFAPVSSTYLKSVAYANGPISIWYQLHFLPVFWIKRTVQWVMFKSWTHVLFNWSKSHWEIVQIKTHAHLNQKPGRMLKSMSETDVVAYLEQVIGTLIDPEGAGLSAGTSTELRPPSFSSLKRARATSIAARCR